jgi:hypothetical protein
LLNSVWYKHFTSQQRENAKATGVLVKHSHQLLNDDMDMSSVSGEVHYPSAAWISDHTGSSGIPHSSLRPGFFCILFFVPDYSCLSTEAASRIEMRASLLAFAHLGYPWQSHRGLGGLGGLCGPSGIAGYLLKVIIRLTSSTPFLSRVIFRYFQKTLG